MFSPRRFFIITARQPSRGGFTLVELLVVIGIIAILAGVALGPITNGIKKAQQSAGVQTSRTLALAEFQYANDHDQTYPCGSDASAIAKTMLALNYISDPSIFYIGGAPSESKYNGTAAATGIATSNISYDFGEFSATSGLSPNAADQMPVVFSSFGTQQSWTTSGAKTIVFKTSNPYGTFGCAVCYKSNSAKFVTASATTTGSTTIIDASFPGGTEITAVGGG